MRRLLCATVLLILLGAPAGGAEKVRLMLDWTPNVDHAPLYWAQARGAFAREGLEVEILTPSDTADPLKLAAAGRTDLALGYMPQALVAASGGIPVRVCARLVARPLSTVVALEDKGIRSAKDLSGKRIGTTVPGMMDVLGKVFARHHGLKDLEWVHVGFQIVPPLASGKVAAVVGAFRNVEVVQLRRQGLKPRVFPLEEGGVPDYDELVVLASPALSKRPRVLAAFRRALAEGLEATRRHPEQALSAYLVAAPGADRGPEREMLDATLPFFAKDQKLDPARWRRFADFALREKLVEKPVDPAPLLLRF